MKSKARLQISEIFYSIQGESSYAGYPCVFIRLTGCNLRCAYCDAAYSYHEPGEDIPLAQIMEKISLYHPGALVEITGGEPLLQEGVYPLLHRLRKAKRTVLLETNGSINVSGVPKGVVKIVDMKCPDSGMQEMMDYDNLLLVTRRDEVKFVLSSRRDYEWARQVAEEYHLAERSNILFSPVAGKLSPAALAEWLLADGLQARLQIQLHTILWPDRTRGG